VLAPAADRRRRSEHLQRQRLLVRLPEAAQCGAHNHVIEVAADHTCRQLAQLLPLDRAPLEHLHRRPAVDGDVAASRLDGLVQRERGRTPERGQPALPGLPVAVAAHPSRADLARGNRRGVRHLARGGRRRPCRRPGCCARGLHGGPHRRRDVSALAGLAEPVPPPCGVRRARARAGSRSAAVCRRAADQPAQPEDRRAVPVAAPVVRRPGQRVGRRAERAARSRPDRRRYDRARLVRPRRCAPHLRAEPQARVARRSEVLRRRSVGRPGCPSPDRDRPVFPGNGASQAAIALRRGAGLSQDRRP
jgi:hypothetical protein